MSRFLTAAGVRALAVCVGLGYSTTGAAIGFGIYDARTLAMGGAAVAAGNAAHAHNYNPALLAFEYGDEDETSNGRIVYPTALAIVSDAGEATVDIVEDDLDQRITDAVNAFNAAPTDTAASQGLLDALQDFDQAIEDINEQPIELEAYVGFSVSEPADREGGSFYFGVRGLVFGEADITQQDLDTLDSYITAAGVLADGGNLAQIDQNLVANGALIDPRPGLTSTGQLSSLLIGEWGIALAKEFSIFGQGVAFGATPKIMQVEVYREDVNFVDDIPSYSENRKSHLTMNFDLGIAAELFDHFRVGLSVRDVLEKTFESENDLDVKLRPRSRLGLAYKNNFLTVGLDYDVQKNKPVATEQELQEVGLGVEFSPWSFVDFRVGYRQDTIGDREDVVSGGARLMRWPFVAEISFATSSDVTAGAIQFGSVF